ERLVLEERGLGEVMRMVAEAIGGSATVLGARGDTIASSGTLAAPAWEALGAAIGARGEIAGPLRERALVLPVVGRDRGAAHALAAAEAGVGAALAPPAGGGLWPCRGARLCAIVDAAGRAPIELARLMRTELSAAHGAVRAAASRAASTQTLRRSFHEARCAL